MTHAWALLALLSLALIGARLFHLLVHQPDEPTATDLYVAQLREKHRRAALAAANRWPRG